MLIPTVLTTLLASGPGAVANVDDPQSHGTVGDALLSLDEAIRLANGTLPVSNLSVQEQARISGTGAVTTIRIDALTTPTITLQSPLTDVVGQGMAVGRVCIEGMASANGKPVLAGGANSHALMLTRHLVTVRGLRFEAADVAIRAQMPAMAGPMAEMPMVMNCEFDGQTTYGVELLATGTDETMLMVRDSRLTNMPVGFRIDDQTNNGRIMSENENLEFDGVGVGCEAFEGGAGMQTMFALWRSTFVNGARLGKVTRSPTSGKLFMFRIVYVDATCSDHVIECVGEPAGNTMIHHHHGDWTAGPGKYALYTHPRTAQFDVHGSEMTFHSDVYIAANTATARVWHQNNNYLNCAITLDCDGALPNLVWNRYDGCTITVPPLARSPVDLRACELFNTDCDSQSFLAPIDLDGCYRTGGALTGFATEQNAAPQAFLGTTSVTPREPQVGTSVTLAADLPFGVALAWDFVPAYQRPNTSQEPVRFYGDPALAVVLPAIVIFQSSLSVPIPNSPNLINLEFYVQGVAFPLLGQSYVPAYHLPRGERITLR
ncbi:MAG: hypothetical protein KAI24_17180 [Planctomycetes bacterium]|nr:hypothetical protein [Planctomycetota bacterium]